MILVHRVDKPDRLELIIIKLVIVLLLANYNLLIATTLVSQSASSEYQATDFKRAASIKLPAVRNVFSSISALQMTSAINSLIYVYQLSSDWIRLRSCALGPVLSRAVGGAALPRLSIVTTGDTYIRIYVHIRLYFITCCQFSYIWIKAWLWCIFGGGRKVHTCPVVIFTFESTVSAQLLLFCPGCLMLSVSASISLACWLPGGIPYIG